MIPNLYNKKKVVGDLVLILKSNRNSRWPWQAYINKACNEVENANFSLSKF